MEAQLALVQISRLTISLMDAITEATLHPGDFPKDATKKLRKAVDVLSKAKMTIEFGKAHCEDKEKPNEWAWSFPGIDTIHVQCDYWRIKEDTQSATLVHESAHTVGVWNWPETYFWPNKEAPHDVGPFGWTGYESVASTYDTWILTQFCVPGYKGVNDPLLKCPGVVDHDPRRGDEECNGQHGPDLKRCGGK